MLTTAKRKIRKRKIKKSKTLPRLHKMKTLKMNKRKTNQIINRKKRMNKEMAMRSEELNHVKPIPLYT